MGIFAPDNPELANRPDQWVELDSLESSGNKNQAIASLINLIPDVGSMQKWLRAEDIPEHERATVGVRKLSGMRGGKDGQGPPVPPSVWLILRWVIASNTSYIREIGDPDLMVRVSSFPAICTRISSSTNCDTGRSQHLQSFDVHLWSS